MQPYFFFYVGIFLLFIAVSLYQILKYCHTKIIKKMEQFLTKSKIIDYDDIIFNTNKNSLLLDVYNRGNLALGESYMAGLWSIPIHSRLIKTKDNQNNYGVGLYRLFRKIMRNKNHVELQHGNSLVKKIMGPFISNQTSGLEMINNHYNLSNKFFESWLDPYMQYSCAYFNKPNMTLEDAQIAKMNLIGRKLKLEPGMTVLDIGCGWGMLAQYLAKTFNVKVVGINLSIEHIKFANDKLKNKGLPVKYIFGDFSAISNYGKKFDRILNVGFMEHVCFDRYNELFSVMYNNLKDDGIALVHTIGSKHGNKTLDPWIQKYIFTRGQIPNLNDMTVNAENNNFVIEDVHNFGLDYGHTLLAWLDRFEKSNSPLKNDITFHRMWQFYLSSTAAAFHERELFLWQIIYTKKNNKNIRYVGER